MTTYPAILTLRRASAPSDHVIEFLKLESVPQDHFSAVFDAGARPYPQAKLGAGSWELESPALRALREKIVAGKRTLKEVYGSPQRGIVTGLNEAFVVDRETRDRLVLKDPKSAELLKPFLEGKDLKRWRAEPRDLWIIYIPKNSIDIDAYPAIKAHLLPFKDQLEDRATKQEWFELQQAQAAYVPAFERPKIVYGEFSGSNIFSIDTAIHYLNNKCYFIPAADHALLALLNSFVFRFFIEGQSVAVRGNFPQLHSQYVELFPIPIDIKQATDDLALRAKTCQTATAGRLSQQHAFRRRIPDLCPPDREAKLNTRLHDWWELVDFDAFRAAVKAHFKAEIPLAERTQWEEWFKAGQSEVARLTAEIEGNEAEINAIVYRLFDLTPLEIKLLEESLQ